jgi:hypothetical protein
VAGNPKKAAFMPVKTFEQKLENDQFHGAGITRSAQNPVICGGYFLASP